MCETFIGLSSENKYKRKQCAFKINDIFLVEKINLLYKVINKFSFCLPIVSFKK